MSDVRDDYLKFKVDDDNKGSGGFFSSIIKILVIVLLLLLLVVLGGLAYKYIFNDTKTVQNNIEPIQPQQTEQNQANQVVQAVQNQVSSGGSVKKEEIALIVKSVLAQMNQNQPVQTQDNSQNIDSEIEEVVDSGDNDAALLNQLSSSDVDNAQEKEMDLSSLDGVDTNTQVKIDAKKKDTFNKVVIEKNNVATKDDLSKLYAKLNSIMKKDKVKAKTKSSTYVKNLTKETKVRSNAMRIITVKMGDTLSLIAARAYGDAMMYPKIYEANPDLVKNPNLIFVGQKLRVPK